MNTLPPSIDDRIIWDNWLSMFRFPVVSAADEVGTFAALSDRSLTTGELAAAIGVDARALGIHLGMLAALAFTVPASFVLLRRGFRPPPSADSEANRR